ncbi:MAG: hypothetical protein HY901_14945 [Deltaproteobacteria bacterium]|nr:hypothetical protein [Deltaproteobacteria bacterium]
MAGREQPSFNLAQAVMLYVYECFQARKSRTLEEAAAPPRASEREVGLVEETLRALLVESGFVDPDRPRHGVLDLLLPLRPAGLSPDDGVDRGRCES